MFVDSVATFMGVDEQVKVDC